MSKIRLPATRPMRSPWKEGRRIGQPPVLPGQVWDIRARPELEDNLRDLALFNLAINGKLGGCDLVRLKVVDLVAGGSIRDRASVIQRKTGRPVQFEVSENTRRTVLAWVASPAMLGQVFLFRTLRHACHLIAAWRDDYNHHRPYSNFDGLTPREYHQRSKEDQTLKRANT